MTVSSQPETAQLSWFDRRSVVRALEILPGLVSWLLLAAPIILSLFEPVVIAYFIIAFDLYWMMKSFRLSFNLIRGYNQLHAAQRVDWNGRLQWLADPNKYLVQTEAELEAFAQRHPSSRWPWWHGPRKVQRQLVQLRDDRTELVRLCAHQRLLLAPEQLYHAVILAVLNEPREILEPSIKALAEVDYPTKQLILIIAYEERGGAATEALAQQLIKQYGSKFFFAKAIKHPDGMPGEIHGKGGNITFAGRQLTEEIRARNIHPERVVVTTFDSDHRASANYFSYLSYLYASDPNRVRKSFQPIPMFYNNIWDAPAPMRVIATGNSFWILMETMRPHRLRNFAAHAQSLAALIATDYWSVTSPVEDGHQFWRTYFAYDGDHEVVPVFTPIYQDAVLAGTYAQTIRAQYKQLRRWAYGISDFPYAVRQSVANPRIPWSNKVVQIWRLFEGHISWATSSITLTAVAWLPLLLNPQFSQQTLAHKLPDITSGILQISSVGIIVTVLISLISLPPRPARYRRSRSVFMLAQWLLLPVTSIVFGSLAAIDAQTRLMLGKYLGFVVTTKAVKK
ncbi:MAG TPA: hypothetical protein VLI05_03415 [Candidatus Saccharimonadia bacterium]|nr:hypothetical protein [Candidatus Saccharimonadia bacterium]